MTAPQFRDEAKTPAAIWLLVAAAFFSTWTGVSSFGYKPGDIALGAAAVCTVFLVGRSTWLPLWVAVAVAAIFLVAASHAYWPTDLDYLNGRYRVVSFLERITRSTREYTGGAAVGTVIQWVIPLALLPFITVRMAAHSPKAVERVLLAWMLGAAVSAGVGITDYLGYTDISTGLVGFDELDDRESGLASHVNNLGFACVMAMPIAIWWMGARRLAGLVALLLLVTGAIISGSRGAQLGAALVVVACVLLTRQGRRAIFRFTSVAVPILLVAVLAQTVFRDSAADFTRFDDAGARESDLGRAELADQAIEDFLHDPLAGIGLEVISEAHSIFLQLLAAGGIVLLFGMLVYWGGAIRTGVQVARSGISSIAPFATIALFAWLGMGAIQNQLTDRYLYFPIAALVALSVYRNNSRARRTSVDASDRAHGSEVSHGELAHLHHRPRPGDGDPESLVVVRQRRHGELR